MKKYLATVCMLACCACVSGQGANFEWAFGMGGILNDTGFEVATDPAGNVITAGQFIDTVDFDPSVQTFNLVAEGWTDIFVHKVDPNGNLLWVVSIGGVDGEAARALAVDASGNIYIAGHFRDTVDFDPGPGVFNLVADGLTDIYVAKLDANGDFVWAIRLGNSNSETLWSMTVDGANDVYVTGDFYGTVDFDPGAGTHSMYAAGMDGFILKLDGASNFLWANYLGGGSSESGFDVATDGLGNVYVCGQFNGTFDFDPGPGVMSVTSAGSFDGYLGKYDSNGIPQWIQSFGSIEHDLVFALATDLSGNIFAAGYYRLTVDFDNGAGVDQHTANGITDIFIMKLDGNGNHQWAKSMGSAWYDDCQSLTTDANGNVYATGRFNSIADFDPGPGTHYLTSNGGWDVYIEMLDPNGDFVWARSFGGTNEDNGYSITSDALGVLYVAGNFNGNVDFNPSGTPWNLTSVGQQDIYVLKLNACVATATVDVVESCDAYTWIDGNTYSSSNNTATYVIPNAAGCDTVVTLDLTVGVDVTVTSSGSTLTAVTDSADYQWLDCIDMSAIVGETGQSFSPGVIGDYAVIVTKNSCSDTSVCTTVADVGTSEVLGGGGVLVYPNPADEVCVVSSDYGFVGASISIVDGVGRLVYLNDAVNGEFLELDLRGVDAGVYLIRVEQDGVLSSACLIVQ